MVELQSDLGGDKGFRLVRSVKRKLKPHEYSEFRKRALEEIKDDEC